jgi:RecA/RadA recombinase
MRRRVTTKRAATNAKMSDLAAAAKAFSAFRPAHEVLSRVRAVPTIFPQFDHATKVGGFPLERITLVHGPSGEGKTSFTLGLVCSFLRRNHLALFVDAERTTPWPWVVTSLGEHATSPLFFARRPTTYEQVVTEVREFCATLRKQRDAGKVHEDTSALIVIDSIRKLVPEDQWKKILQLGKDKGDGKVKDRSAQIKAAMNAAWCDELIPLLEQSSAGMVIIARETEDPDANARSRMYGTNYKVGGGKALYYDASLDVRVERQKYVVKEVKEGLRPLVYGERHRITIKKSKVAGKEDKTTICYFHTSNGTLTPEGFDRARDVVELAKRFGIVKGESWISWRSSRWQGEHAAVRKLSSSPEILDALEAEVRAKFKSGDALEVDEDGVIP